MEARREVAIRGLMVYLREKEEGLFKEDVNQTPLYFEFTETECVLHRTLQLNKNSGGRFYIKELCLCGIFPLQTLKTFVLILTYQDGDRDITGEVVKIVTTQGGIPAAHAKIVLEGTEVLTDVDIPRACALLMGLIYALNLSYPKELKKHS